METAARLGPARVEVRDLYALYPDYLIDVAEEQALLAEALTLRAGRKVEARFQWSRVLTLTPTAKTKAEAEGKLANGLPELTGPPAPPVPAPPPRPLPGGGTRT